MYQITRIGREVRTDLREGAVIPNVALIRKEVSDKTRMVVEGVLQDRVETLFARYLG